MMTYSDLLKDPIWQRRRLEILQRDDYTCQKCKNQRKQLHIHHRHYINGRKPWDYPDGLLVTLCISCHKEEEACATDAKSVFETLHMLGMFNTDIRQALNQIVEKQLAKSLQIPDNVKKV
jgi:hypothetical protein